MTPDELHANHHRLIAERVESYRSLIRGAAAVRARDARKLAWTTVSRHMSHPHGARSGGPAVSLDDLLARHDSLHSEDRSSLPG